MDRLISFEKVYSRTDKFILKCNLRYTSSIMGMSMRMKSAEHGKIFNFLKSKVNDTFLLT